MGGDSSKCACGILLALLGGSPSLTGVQYLYSSLQYQRLSNWKVIARIKMVESCTECIKPHSALLPHSASKLQQPALFSAPEVGTEKVKGAMKVLEKCIFPS